MIRSGLGKHKK
jgi:hypothetical protein